MICVECGTEAEHLIGGSCAACFTRKTPLLEVPDVLDVELCSHCDARKVGAHWVDKQEEMPLAWIREDAVREAVRIHKEVQEPYLDFDESPQDDKHFQVHIHLEGRIEAVEVQGDRTVLVRQKRGVCDRCSRMQGDYYAAIIQLRATDRDVTPAELERAHGAVAQELERQLASGNRFAFLTKDGPIHGGWDYYVGDIEAARGVSRVLKDRLGASMQESAKLVGRREGDDVYRVTFLVRVRLFAPGDFAAVDGRTPVQIQQVSQGRAICTDLLTHQKTRVGEDRLRRIGGREVLEEAVVVSQDSAGLQLLDPQDYKTREALPPPDLNLSGETVQVLRFKGQLFIVSVPTGAFNKV